MKKGQLQAENGTLFTSLGVSSASLDFESLNNFGTAENASNLHIVGGMLQIYDGVSVTEKSFQVFPENITTSQIPAGAIADGNYQYVVVYAWVDNIGQIHRSAPSIPTSVTISGGHKNIQLTIPTLRISKKSGVFVEIYRTEDNGTLFYKVTSNTSLTLNDSTVDTITYTDTKTNANLVSGELLYTTGGVLENIAPPPSSIITNFKNRIVIKSSDEPNVLWYSKIRQEGDPVEFSDSLRIVVDPKGGDITAISSMDDKLIIFKKQRIFVQAGDGPNNLGEQSDFGLPQLITADAGCVDVSSVVETPVGLMFKSEKGIYLLDRGLSVTYIGDEVEKFNGSSITSAVLVADANQVRFTTQDNLCLVYDYYFKQWSTFTNHEAVGATNFGSNYCFVKDTGSVYVQNNSKYTDGANSVKMKIVSSWIQAGDIEGYQRFYKLLLLGSYKSKHRLRIRLGYDFNPVFVQEVMLDPHSVLNPTAYGESSPYGSESLYGGSAQLYQWRIFPQRQKCQAFRVSIEDIMDDVFGESFDIVAMRLEVGVKQGSNKLGTSNSFGTE